MQKKNFLELKDEFKNNYKLSEYNLYLDKDMGVVYNTISQAVAAFDNKTIDDSMLESALENGFVVSNETDELDELRKEYESREVFSDTFHIIIAPTLDCQFRCFYCYENHPKKYMNKDVEACIVGLVEDKVGMGKNLSVVWYGGEPLLGYETIKSLTCKFKAVCNKYKANYTASMISNGYSFNDDNISELDELGIKSVQITLDGMKDVHEKRRPHIDKKASFDKIIDNVKKINEKTETQIKLRINVDKTNVQSAYSLIEYCDEQDLKNIDVTLGMMKAFGCDNSCSCTQKLFSMAEFSEEFLNFRKHLKALGYNKAIEKMVPEYKVNSCTMDAPDAYVIDPDGYVYKCISLVGQRNKSIGNLKDGFNESAHKKYSPFLSETCSRCTYLPICKGGCLLNNNSRYKECNIWKFITERLVIDTIEEL